MTTSGGKHFKNIRLFFSTLSCWRERGKERERERKLALHAQSYGQTDSENSGPLRHDKIFFLKMTTVYQHVWASTQVQARRIRKYGFFWDLISSDLQNMNR